MCQQFYRYNYRETIGKFEQVTYELDTIRYENLKFKLVFYCTFNAEATLNNNN